MESGCTSRFMRAKNNGMTEKGNTLPVLHLGPGVPPVEVLYVDGDLLVLNKPAGLLSVPDRWDAARPNIMRLLHDGIRKPAGWATSLGLVYVANAHRIDFDTSGVFVLARSRSALAKLVRAFRDHDVKKSYVALVHGCLPESPLVIDKPIAPDPRKPGHSMISLRGRPSLSRAETITKFRGVSFVRVWPETGRQHQVRVHLAAVGCPIVADRGYAPSGAPLYLSEFKRRYSTGDAGEKALVARQALHAESIEFIHPSTSQPLRIEAPLPRDLAVAVKQLTKYALA